MKSLFRGIEGIGFRFRVLGFFLGFLGFRVWGSRFRVVYLWPGFVREVGLRIQELRIHSGCLWRP